MKNMTFQNRATLVWRKLRSSSLFSLLGEALRLDIRALLTGPSSIASCIAGIQRNLGRRRE